VRWLPLLVTGMLIILASAYFRRSRSAVGPGRGAPRDSALIELRDRGDRARAQRTQAGIADAVRLYADAIARDSGYAQAWNGLARSYLFAYSWGFTIPGVPHDSLLSRALRASDEAFVADSGLSSTWVTRALVMRQVNPSTRVDVFRAVRRALTIDSLDAEAWGAYAATLSDTDSLDKAIDAWRRAVGLRPAYAEAAGFLALTHLWSRHYDSAATWADSAIALSPTYLLARHAAGYDALALGDAARAEREFAAAEHLGGGAEHISSLAGLAMARAAGGDRHGALRALQAADSAASRDHVYPVHSVVYLAEAWGALGEQDRAFAWLRRFEQPLDLHFQLHLRHDTGMDTLRGDPRFAAFLARPTR
jgi:tetratricopeptide (TPR) repeat protein